MSSALNTVSSESLKKPTAKRLSLQWLFRFLERYSSFHKGSRSDKEKEIYPRSRWPVSFLHALQGTKQSTLELGRRELQGATFSWLPIITRFQHLSTFLIVLHGSQEEVKTHFSRSAATLLCAAAAGSPVTRSSQLHHHRNLTPGHLSKGCARGPPDTRSGRHPREGQPVPAPPPFVLSHWK